MKGDWGEATPAQAEVSRAMCAAHDQRALEFTLTTGDNFSAPDGAATLENFARPESCLIERGIPYIAAWGNHDVEGDATATALGATERDYTVRRGPLRLVILDGNRPDDAAQRDRLIRRLARRDAAATVVVVHQPLRSGGVYRGGPARWSRIVERAGATLVLQGHNHFYERIHHQGTAYVTTGGGGAYLTPCLLPQPGQAKCRPRHHFLEVTADEQRIRLRARDASGDDIDRVTLPVRGGIADPRRLVRWTRW